MRIDLFLRLAGLVKTRTQAGKACDAGAVTLNGRRAKCASTVEAGSVLGLTRPDGSTLTVEVLTVPEGRNVSRGERSSLYRLLEGPVPC